MDSQNDNNSDVVERSYSDSERFTNSYSSTGINTGNASEDSASIDNFFNTNSEFSDTTANMPNEQILKLIILKVLV